MKKLLLSLCMMAASFCGLRAQQVEVFSLLRENNFAVNPAVTGTRGFLYGVISARKQFYKIDQSPYTILAGMHGQFEGRNFWRGGYALHDVTGPTGKTSGTLSFAYQVKFGKDGADKWNTASTHLLSFGLAASVVQYRLAGNELLPNDAGDPELYTSRAYKILPDVSFGVWYQWHEHLYAGVSVPQLLGLNIDYSGRDGNSQIKRVQHLYGMVGGKYALLNGKLSFDPVAAVRWVKGAPFQFDAGLRIHAFKWVYAGCNYRSEKRIVIEGGMNYKQWFTVSYAYDYDLRPYGPSIGGSHELALTFKINKRQKDF